MVILKKIKASSLNEVIVATVIIILIFGIAVATLSNILMNIANRNTNSIDTKLNELIYSFHNDQLELPYNEESEEVSIQITKITEEQNKSIRFQIIHKKNKKKRERKLVLHD